QQGGPLPVDAACDCVRQAALALQHAHEQGLVHRDVKPSNLMLTPSGLVKLLDLGLVRRSDEDTEGSSELTASGMVLGTLDFMAPEQAVNAHAADIRADLYSLGCTFYFLLAGRPPFAAASPMDKVFQHQWAEPPALASLRPEVPPAMAALVGKLMAK